jgi:hypothetical protein
MELKQFRKLLADSLSIVDIGVKKGYFKEEDKDYLNTLLLQMFKKGIVEDIQGKAIYGMYVINEKRLYFNAKVYKNEVEALTYILHEIKHGLDHFKDSIGFENNGQFVGINEGATQRFATDIAEEILSIRIPEKSQTSLGIMLETNLDEYQIEDKLNQLFCKVMNISMAQFLKMQNAQDKKEFNDLITKFNKFADFNIFKESIDGIYKIQEETWFDENGQLLEEEAKPTIEQTQRAVHLINKCQNELIKYAKQNNLEDTIKEKLIVATNIRGTNDNIVLQERELQDDEVINEFDYINYHRNIVNQLKSKNLLNDDAQTIFVTEFRYEQDKETKVVYYRIGTEYKKIIVPVFDDGSLDLAHCSNLSVNDINEIISSIADYEAEFGVIANAQEYSKLLESIGKQDDSINVLKRWSTYLTKQNQVEELRAKQQANAQVMIDIMAKLREDLSPTELANEDDLNSIVDDSPVIKYGSIIISENGIDVIQSDGSIYFVPSEEEQSYIAKVKAGIMLDSVKLNESQRALLDSYQQKIEDQCHKTK